LELFETVSRAVLDSQELDFEYKKLGSPRYEVRRVQPYHLGCIEDQWYLCGFDLTREQLRTFALPRMRTVPQSAGAVPAARELLHHPAPRRQF